MDPEATTAVSPNSQDKQTSQGWDSFHAPELIRAIPVPGNHFTLINHPQILAVLGERLSELLG